MQVEGDEVERDEVEATKRTEYGYSKFTTVEIK